MTRLSLVAALLLVGCQAPASEDDLGRQELPVLGGVVDDTHDAVVSITTLPDGDRPELCTGVLVAPRVVISAGHCTIGRAPAELVVGVGRDASKPDRTLPVAAVHTPDRYTVTRSDDARGLDIGALVLAADAGIAPLAIARAPRASVGTVAQAIGFGQSTLDAETRGTRNAATVRIVSTCSTLLGFGDATTNACHGDSGGPLLVEGTIVGFVSYGSESCDPPTFAVRADAYAAWIDGVIAGAADDACSSHCPPPGDDCVGSPSDAAVDALDDGSRDAQASPPPPSNEGCTASRRARSPRDLTVLVAVASLALVRARSRRERRRRALSRRCSGACSRSSTDRCR